MSFFCIGNEPKSGLARDLGDCLQSRNVPFGTSGDLCERTVLFCREIPFLKQMKKRTETVKSE